MGNGDEKGNNVHGDTYYTNQIYKYESDDRQILVDLLREYSEKLVDTCDRLTPTRKAIIMPDYYSIPLIVAATSGLTLVASIRHWMQWKNTSSTAVTVNASDFIIIITCLALLFFTILSKQQKPPSRKEKSLTEREAKNIAIKLEKLIKITTEIQDQIELNLARKIELDLRIADAESALDYYYSTIERKDRK